MTSWQFVLKRYRGSFGFSPLARNLPQDKNIGYSCIFIYSLRYIIYPFWVTLKGGSNQCAPVPTPLYPPPPDTKCRVVLLSQLALLFHHYGDRRFNHHLNCRYQALCLWLLMPCSALALWWLDCTSSLLEVSLSIFLCLPHIVILAALPHNVENIIIHFTLQRLKNWPPFILFFSITNHK